MITQRDILCTVCGVISTITFTYLYSQYTIDPQSINNIYSNSNDTATGNGPEDIDSSPDTITDHSIQHQHCSSTINQLELYKSRIILHDALNKIFHTVDTQRNGYITQLQFMLFVKNLGLTGDRESALMNIVGFNTADPPPHHDTNDSTEVDNNSKRCTLHEFVNRFDGTLTNTGNELFTSSCTTPPHTPRITSIHTTQQTPSTSDSTQQQSLQSLNIRVFLGGACGSSTWRQNIAIPLLESNSITYYNPHVAEWHSNLISLEQLMKVWCKVLLFVIDESSRSCGSMVEAAALISEGRNIVIVLCDIQPHTIINNISISVDEARDINRGRQYLYDLCTANQIHVYNNVYDAVHHIITEAQSEYMSINASPHHTNNHHTLQSNDLSSPLTSPHYYAESKRKFVFNTNSTQTSPSITCSSSTSSSQHTYNKLYHTNSLTLPIQLNNVELNNNMRNNRSTNRRQTKTQSDDLFSTGNKYNIDTTSYVLPSVG